MHTRWSQCTRVEASAHALKRPRKFQTKIDLGQNLSDVQYSCVAGDHCPALIEKKAASSDDWAGAPPCLITLVSQGVGENRRNECLFQVGIYLRQRFPEELETKLDYYNLTYFKPPLPSKEVQTLLGQVSDRKNYFFMLTKLC